MYAVGGALAQADHYIPHWNPCTGETARLDGGDLMVAVLIRHASLDKRDLTHIWVCSSPMIPYETILTIR